MILAFCNRLATTTSPVMTRIARGKQGQEISNYRKEISNPSLVIKHPVLDIKQY
jgi:hypothetical protein